MKESGFLHFNTIFKNKNRNKWVYPVNPRFARKLNYTFLGQWRLLGEATYHMSRLSRATHRDKSPEDRNGSLMVNISCLTWVCQNLYLVSLSPRGSSRKEGLMILKVKPTSYLITGCNCHLLKIDLQGSVLGSESADGDLRSELFKTQDMPLWSCPVEWSWPAPYSRSTVTSLTWSTILNGVFPQRSLKYIQVLSLVPLKRLDTCWKLRCLLLRKDRKSGEWWLSCKWLLFSWKKFCTPTEECISYLPSGIIWKS